jgi:beta-glucosidase/6-phospho-beta-glucosidase/beta-galactosidase
MPGPGQGIADGRFRFAVGIEDTFVPQASLGRRPLDEYELTQHYHHWHGDLGLARETGATAIRYGVPWYRINPEPGSFRWGWLDRVVDRLEELGFETVVDLMHYGTPLWLDNQFLNASYPSRVAEYAAAVAQRYRGRLRAYTPLNEPLVNAKWCGELGNWPPYLTGHDGFVKLMRALVRGIVETQRAVADASGGTATFVHVEAAELYLGEPPEAVGSLELLRARPYLAEDLVTGRVVDDAHPLAGYLRANGFGDDDLAWCAENTAHPDVMGVNYYPMLSVTEYLAGPSQTVRKGPGGVEGLEEVVRGFAGRYGVPVFITETSGVGDVAARLRWLEASVAAAARLRAEGVPLVGYTWWPLFHFFDWPYRDAVGPVDPHLMEMGMYDLEPDDVGVLRRVRTPVVDRFRELADRGVP